MSAAGRSAGRRSVDADGHFDDSLIDGGDAALFASSRMDDSRREGERPWPRPPPGVPPPFDDEPPRRIVRVVNSLFPHKKPTVFFDYPSFVGMYALLCVLLLLARAVRQVASVTVVCVLSDGYVAAARPAWPDDMIASLLLIFYYFCK